MKKTALIICIMLVMIPLICMNALAEADTVTVYKTTVAPEIDGELDDCYRPVANTIENDDLFNVLTTTDGIKTDVDFYACWDDDFFYIYVKAACNEPHIAYQDDEIDHFIFNAHYMMTAICPDDSTKSVYTGAEAGGGWKWGTLDSANLMYEWTVIEDSNDEKNVISNHFNNVESKAGFKYDVKSGGGFDCYEQKIPMKLLVTSQVKNGLIPKPGAIFGFGFAIGFTDTGTGYDGDKNTVKLSNYFLDNKIVNDLTLVELASDLTEESSEEEESVEISAETSSKEPDLEKSAEDKSKSESEKADDDDKSYKSDDIEKDESESFDDWWIVIAGAALVVIAVTVVIIRKKKTE
ncbi:MAG: hypothetical protein PHD66_01505 [Eubacteriales bacterium]|nr:hypothetical protein [Eubacteriales bacterium]